MSPDNYEDPILTPGLKETITRMDYFFLVSGLLCAFAAYVLEKPYSDTIAYIGAGCISISIILLAYRFIRWDCE